MGENINHISLKRLKHLVYLFPCSLLYSPQYLDLVPTRSIISGMLLANIACKTNILTTINSVIL